MYDKELRDGGFPAVWDNTLRSYLRKCPRRGYWFLRGYASSFRASYFAWGSCWHKGLQTYHQTEDITEALHAAFLLWNDEAPEESGNDTIQNLEAKLKLYASTYSDNYEVIGTEIGWKLPLNLVIEDKPILIGGAIDELIKVNDLIVPVEIKTSGSYLSQGYIDQWPISSQIAGYIYYNNTKGGCLSCVIDLMTKKPKGVKSNWTTPEFYRTEVTKTEAQLNEFIEDLIAELGHFYENYWKRWHWPKLGEVDARNCVGGVGFSACPYKILCRSSEPLEDIDPIANSGGFLELREPWEPWKGGEET